MRAVLFVMALAATAGAQPKPKAMPDKLVKAASEAFAKAQAADAKGDFNEAIRQYERALAISEHPFTVFNLADVERRAKNYDRAIDRYKQYLELERDAKDRDAVEKVIHDLETMPATLDVTSEEPDAIVFIDGKRVGPASKYEIVDNRRVDKPTRYTVIGGTHQVDVVTPITFIHQTCTVARGRDSSCSMSGRPRVDGNVIISASWNMGGLSWPVEKQRFQVHGRFVAKPGHYELKVNDRQCKPLPLDVPASEDAITYAFITWPEPLPDRPACIPLTITQQRVTF